MDWKIFCSAFVAYAIISGAGWLTRRIYRWACRPYPPPTTNEIEAMNRRLKRQGLDPKKHWEHGMEA